METLNDMRLAVLIDADNIPYSNIKGMMEEIALYGTPTLKRILRILPTFSLQWGLKLRL